MAVPEKYMPTGAETRALENGPCRMRPPKIERRANSSSTCRGLKSPNMPAAVARCASVTVTLAPKVSPTLTSAYHFPENMPERKVPPSRRRLSLLEVRLVRQAGELDQLFDRGCVGKRDGRGTVVAAHHDHEALAAAQVVPAAADLLAVQVAHHAAAADALFVANDPAAIVEARHEEGDLRHLFAGFAVAHRVLVADDVALGVLQVLVRHGLGLE